MIAIAIALLIVVTFLSIIIIMNLDVKTRLKERKILEQFRKQRIEDSKKIYNLEKNINTYEYFAKNTMKKLKEDFFINPEILGTKMKKEEKIKLTEVLSENTNMTPEETEEVIKYFRKDFFK